MIDIKITDMCNKCDGEIYAEMEIPLTKKKKIKKQKFTIHHLNFLEKKKFGKEMAISSINENVQL